jgi:tetratricopeptide (TPR) repeat protein
MNKGNWKSAVEIFTEALEIDPSNKKFMFKVSQKLGEANLQLGNSCLLLRAKTHFILNEFEDCIIDCEEYLNLHGNDNEEVDKLIKASEDALKTGKLPHEILGISLNAAYRLSAPFSPKNQANATNIDRMKANRKRLEIQSAYRNFMSTKQ